MKLVSSCNKGVGIKTDAVSLRQLTLQVLSSYSKRRRGAGMGGSRGSKPALGLCLSTRDRSESGHWVWASSIPAWL